MDFQKYMADFEEQVVCAGIADGSLGCECQIPIRNGRLASRKFGKLIGGTVRSGMPFAIDYYGLIKKSDGFMAMIGELSETVSLQQIKSVSGTIVHFASIRMDRIAVLAPELIVDFTEFKRQMLDLRGFRHGFGK